MKRKNPGVFKEPSHDTADLDIFAQAGHAGDQTTDSSHRQTDFDAGLRGLIKFLDHRGIFQGIDLGKNGAVTVFLGIFDLPID